MTNQTQTNINIDLSEKQIEDFLCEDNNLEKYLGLKFIARQVAIPPVGIIDILAYNKQTKTWVIIELKKDNLDESAFCQLFGYVNFLKQTKYKDIFGEITQHKFVGLLIGKHLNDKLNKIVKIYNEDVLDPEDTFSGLFYKLFNFTLTNGFELSWYNQNQFETQEEIRYIADRNQKIRIDIICKKPNGFF